MKQQRRIKLLRTFQAISRRQCSIFFSKLVLFGEQLPQVKRIGYYDIQCEAAINITDVLQSVIKRIQFKFFYLLKITTKNNYQHTPQKTQEGQISHQTSQIKLMRQIFGNSPTSSNLTSFPSMPILGRRSRMVSELSEVDCSMRALMSKVNFLTEKLGKKSRQRNHQHQKYEKSEYLEKSQKQKLISQKLSKIESDLSALFEEEIHINYETNSNISNRKKQPNHNHFYSTHTYYPNKMVRNRTKTTCFTQFFSKQ